MFQTYVKKKDNEGEGQDAYATDDPTVQTTAKEQEEMAKEAIKKFKALRG